MNEKQREFYGKTAYEAYCGARNWLGFAGQPLPQWTEVKDEIKHGWREAAIAVLSSLPSKN